MTNMLRPEIGLRKFWYLDPQNSWFLGDPAAVGTLTELHRRLSRMSHRNQSRTPRQALPL